jgi:HSP20 family protein
MLPVLYNRALAPTTSGGPANRISSLWDRFFDNDWCAPLTAGPSWTTLPMAVWEDEHNIYVAVDLPGVTDKDIELSLLQGDLFIRGERKCECTEGKKALYDDRSFGRFEQRVSLPAAVDGDKVEARLVAGVLNITLPKHPEARPRKIQLESK